MSLTDNNRVRDEILHVAEYRRPLLATVALNGKGIARLFGPDGKVLQRVPFKNLVTQNGDQFYGDRAAGVLGSTTAITSSTNATPIVVTTTAAHGLAVGDNVVVAGHTVNTNAVGTWRISAATSTTLTLQGSVGNGGGGATGTVQGLSQPPASGMRLGTGVTAAAKTGAGAAIVTYVTTSQRPFDATYPSSSLSGSSRRITYQATWAAGVATSAGISEAVVTNESILTDVAGVAANTVSRALLSSVVNKGASDSLVITWTQDILGS